MFIKKTLNKAKQKNYIIFSEIIFLLSFCLFAQSNACKKNIVFAKEQNNKFNSWYIFLIFFYQCVDFSLKGGKNHLIDSLKSKFSINKICAFVTVSNEIAKHNIYNLLVAIWKRFFLFKSANIWGEHARSKRI